MFPINSLSIVLIVFGLLQANCDNHLWHSYRLSADHQSREELVITNVTSDHEFSLKVNATKWKSYTKGDSIAVVAGLMDTRVIVGVLTENKNYTIDARFKVVDVALSEQWNTTLRKFQIFMVIATEEPQLIWYLLDDAGPVIFWQWPLTKNISHINVFQIQNRHHLLVINTYQQQTTGDLYEFELKPRLNFWMNQAITLADPAGSSAVATHGPDTFLAIPQKSLRSLLIYKRQECHFVTYRNVSSYGVDQVVTFATGSKVFLAFNGYDAAILRFTKKGLFREHVDFALDGVDFWIPIPVNTYREEVLLLAQRLLDHGAHQSFVVDGYTYDGARFNKHDDVDCSYFGGHFVGFSCLIGEENKRGMLGSAAIVTGDSVALLVPRDGSQSELFILNTAMVKTPNPVQERVQQMLKTKQYLDNLLTSQRQEIAEIKKNMPLLKNDQTMSASLRSAVPTFAELKSQLSVLEKKLENLKDRVKTASDQELKNHYSKIYFNNIVNIEGQAIFEDLETLKIEGELVAPLMDDIGRKDQPRPFNGPKSLENLEIDHLEVGRINGIDTRNLIFSTQNSVEISGDLILQKPLEVSRNLTSHEVNGIADFKGNVVNFEKPVTSPISFGSIEVLKEFNTQRLNDVPIARNSKLSEKNQEISWNNTEFETLLIEHSVEVGRVNGENFTEFLNEICLKNINTYIPGTFEVEGNITVLEDLSLFFLNGLGFPEDFVLGGRIGNIKITGRKVFEGDLTVDDLQSSGPVDGIDTTKVITLSTEQNITGKPMFDNLKVMESFNVDGQVLGEYTDKFLPNPTLLDTNLVKSRVVFRNLEVDGDIIISQSYNGKKFEEVLEDIVYKDDREVTIESMKQFPESFTVRKNLEISSDSINNIDLASFVRKDNQQRMIFDTITGSVVFGNIQTADLYDSIDLRKLDKEAVRLTGEQYLSSTLVFSEKLQASNLEIIKELNNQTLEEYLGSRQREEFAEGFLNMEHISCENVEITGNLIGKLNQFDLGKFDKRKLSLHKDQSISGGYRTNNSKVGDLRVDKVNDNIYFSDLFDQNVLRKKLIYNMASGKLRVKNLHVNGSLNIAQINDMDGLNLGGAFWLDGFKRLQSRNLTFLNDVHFSNLTIQNLSGINFDKFVSSIVFKSQSHPVIKGSKVFVKGFSVDKWIETERINGVLLNNILRGHGNQTLHAPLTVEGNVTILEDAEVAEDINEVSLKKILDVYKVFNDTHTVKGDVLFNRLPHIRSLQADSFVGDSSAQKFLDEMVFKNEDFVLNGNTVFKNRVGINGNLRIVGRINNVSLPVFMSNLVTTTKDTEVNGPLRFTQPVTIKQNLRLDGDLRTKTLNNLDLEQWTQNAVFVDRGMLFGNYTFQKAEVVEKLTTNYINNVDVESLVPLRTEQNITELWFDEISSFGNISVGDLVNGWYLPMELNRTVMTDSNQHLPFLTEFMGNVYVNNNLEIINTLNDLDLTLLVTTNTPQNLTASYDFKSKAILEQDLWVDGLVSEINMTEWFNKSVGISSLPDQTIRDHWSVNNLEFDSNVTGRALINGLNLEEFRNLVEEKRNFKYQDEYSDMCQDLSFMYRWVRNQIYKFDYLERLQLLSFRNDVHYVHPFQYAEHNFLIVNEKNTCRSNLLLFMPYRYVHIRELNLGQVDQMISVTTGDSLLLVSRNSLSSKACKIRGTNIWRFLESGDLVRTEIMESQDLLQESQVPGTFYAIRKGEVVEYKVSPNSAPIVRKHRKWMVFEENMAFVPRGLGTGLAVRTGSKLVRLHRKENLVVDPNLGYETEIIAVANVTVESNNFLPGQDGGDLVVMTVGIKSSKRNLLAVASHEKTSVMGSLDFIKIYEGSASGNLFQKLLTYKPSSLISLEFENGETLLAFLEDESTLQVYEYKGIEGFKHRLSAKLEGSKLFRVTVPTTNGPFKNDRRIIGLVNKKEIHFIEAVMLGNQIKEDLKCML